jgi:hypothetical protein
MRAALLLALAGCSSGGGGGTVDLAGGIPDAAGHDLAGQPLDLAAAGDQSVPVDLAGAPADQTQPADLFTPADLSAGCCGMPGDVGDANGIGKYCLVANDCPVNMFGVFCATQIDPNLRYCAVSCTGVCMAGYTCENLQGGAVCVPNSCLPLPQGC